MQSPDTRGWYSECGEIEKQTKYLEYEVRYNLIAACTVNISVPVHCHRTADQENFEEDY